ncbi:hypothetical protein ACSHWC_09125 [Pseudomonas fluorescens]
MKNPTVASRLNICLILLACTPAMATTPPALTDNAAPLHLTNTDGQNDRWSGIGYFQARRGCNASLLDTRSGQSDGPAYVLTSAHCFEAPRDQLIATDISLDTEITFNNFQDTQANQRRYKIKRINWLSLQGTNLAIAELDTRLSAIIASGIQPLSLSYDMTEPRRALLVGASLHPEPQTLAIRACTLQRSPNTLAVPWVWRNALKTQCNIRSSGAAGSPLLDSTTNAIVAVLGEVPLARNAHLICDRAAPCDIVDTTTQWYPDTQYAHTVTHFSHCWNEGTLQTIPALCRLFPANTVTLTRPQLTQTYLPADTEAGLPAIWPTWNLRFTITSPFYRQKVVRSPLECESPHGYSQALPSTNAYINTAMGSSGGISTLCIAGAHSEVQGPFWGDMKNATALVVELKEQGPLWQPAITSKGFGFVRTTLLELTVHRDPNFNTRYFFKYGEPNLTQCEVLDEYIEIDNEAFANDAFNIVRQPQAKRHCLYSLNIRNERSAIKNYILPASQTE